MSKRAVNVSSLVLLLAVLSFLFEISLYYFIPGVVVILVMSVVTLGLTHYFTESTLDYGNCFLMSAFLTISSTAFGIVVYLLQPNKLLEYSYSLWVLVILSWLIPFGYCFIRDFFDRGPRFGGYLFFFNGMSAVFIVIYFIAITKQFFVTPFLPPYKELAFGANNFVPFMATGNYIESALEKGDSITSIIVYIVQIVLFGIPFGFYVRVYARSLSRIIRIAIYIVSPVLLEFLQFLTGRGRGHIDDFAFGIIGIIIGVGIYYLVNGISNEVNKRDFLEDRTITKSLLFHF